MVKKRVSNVEFEREYAAAVERGRQRAAGPRAKAVFYDKDEDAIVLKFSTGGSIEIPRGLLDELDDARPEELAEVELSPRGTALHWEKLDVDVSVVGALALLIGPRIWMSAMGSLGGRSTSPVKAEAARNNGMKGGRPPLRGHVPDRSRASASSGAEAHVSRVTSSKGGSSKSGVKR
jgi:hypothetical protein